MKLFLIPLSFLLFSCTSSELYLDSKDFVETPFIQIKNNEPILHLNRPSFEGLELKVEIKGSQVIIISTDMSSYAKHFYKVSLTQLNNQLKILNSSQLNYYWMNPDGQLAPLEVR